MQFLSLCKSLNYEWVATVGNKQDFKIVVVLSPTVCWRTLHSWCTVQISPFLQLLLQPISGPSRCYACRSHLYVISIIVYFKKCIMHIGNVLLTSCLHTLTLKSTIHSNAIKKVLRFASKHCLCYIKASSLMKKWPQWVFINVFQLFLFKRKKSVLLFLPFYVVYFCLNGTAEQTKLLYFLHILTLTGC